jgi:hypothetical protein
MMQTQTIILIALALLASFGLSYIQYIYKAKTKRMYVFVLAFLRFCSFFILFLLLINPIIKSKSTQIQKVVLPVLIDNSQSMAYLDSNFVKTDWLNYFKNNKKLNDKFDVAIYPFDKQLHTIGSAMDFKGAETRITNAATSLNEIYRNVYQPILLITDGNQTQGADYIYAFNPNAKVFPIIVGDTTTVFDAQLIQAHANKYVYINNKFPIEVFANVVTSQTTQVDVLITEGSKQLYKKAFTITPDNTIINEVIYLTANTVGIKKYKVEVVAKQPEKNTMNNSKVVVVDVIDQKTEIALISDIIHPDLGAIKRAIESNEHRKVTIVNPKNVSNIQNYDLVILYQPNTTFTNIWKQINQTNKNYWLIGGLHTDYAFLNKNQADFIFKLYNQKEQYRADKVDYFSIFETPNLPFTNLPFLDFPFGTVEVQTQNTPLLYLNTKGIKTNIPMLSFVEQNNQKKAYWLGENVWKWRLETISDFNYFDQFMDKIVQYLVINQPKQNLVVHIDNVYNQTDNIEIVAQYFNKNLELDNQAILEAHVQHLDSKTIYKYNFNKRINESFLNLPDLIPGNYQIKITEKNTKTQIIKNFEVLAFNPELQTTRANLTQLKLVALQSETKYYEVKNIDQAIHDLLSNSDYVPIQKEILVKQQLINWKYSLIFILILLVLEWFIRKYNGLK